ncbi:hypothetical protein, conserved [Eimeria acervulina]|uniref:Uncharacterized protein n=1 Tax=Eimeria acervulina TaxID=5801 RepID=U6GIJ1_EIMAC|nr:hypothetical protein, conserved [Eimeria acervulina]CDI79392.1 hypothetical protein, conserved [Eimeria acervulina]
MAAPAASDGPSSPDAVSLSGLQESSHSARPVLGTADVPAASAAQGPVSTISSKSSCPAQLLPSSLDKTVASSENSTGAFFSPQAGREATARLSLTRQSVGRQSAPSSRVCGTRTKCTRACAAVSVTQQQRDTAEAHANAREAHRNRNYGTSCPQSALCSEVPPSFRGRGAKNCARPGMEAGPAATPATSTDDGSFGRGLHRVAEDAGAAGAVPAATPRAGVHESSSTAAATPAASLDCRGPRRSLRQALLANSGKVQVTGPTGCASTAGESLGGGGAAAAATGSVPGNPAAALAGAAGAFVGPTAASGGRRRMRQPHRQVLQSYTVGQQHQQTGPQADDRTKCLAEWLDIRGSSPRCCCGASCVSCIASCSGKANNASAAEGAFGSTSGGGGGSGSRSVLEAYATAAAKGDKHQRQQLQQQCSSGSGFAAPHSDRKSGDGILVCPSWFESPYELEMPSALSCIRPLSPSRSVIFASQQAAWEEEDMAEAAEAAVATAGTPWPEGSTSCSFGGYGAATRNGGQVPLCCYCGLPLRPPAISTLRGGGAESGCPLAAAAAAAASLGLEGWTQWCRCCTRVYGDLRLQHQRNATGLPFASFSLPKAPLRYLLLPADSAKDTPEGVGAVAAALAAAAVADSRRSKLNDENAAAASGEADGDSVAATTAWTPNSNSKSSSIGNTALLRRTRSGHHFARAPSARSSSRSSNNPSDIMRYMGASCCWPSSASSVSYMQPLARIQQRLTQLQQHLAVQGQQQQQKQRGSVERPSALVALQLAPVDGSKILSLSSPTTASSSSLAAAASAGATPSSPAVDTEPVPGTGAKDPSDASHPYETQRFAELGQGEAAPVSLVDTGSWAVPADVGVAALRAVQTAAQRVASAHTLVAAHGRSSGCLGTSRESRASKVPAAKTETPTAKARTVVIPRVYLESSSDCYVATAYDSVRQRLLQKRFCCTVLGEQRAHALACQWLRWVSKGAAAAAQKSRMPQTEPTNASVVQAATTAAAAAQPASGLLADGFATVPTAAALPGRRAAAGGLWGVRRGSHRVDTGVLLQQQEHLRSERHLKRRRRCGEALENSDRDEGSFPSQTFPATASQGQQIEEV